MGMVFKAQHRRMKRVVALKVLPPSYAKDGSAVLRFQRKAQAVARLGHPNIVAALDADVFNGLHYFAMEYVEGSDLARLVREKGTLPVDQAIAFVKQAAQGLKAAHDKGIYHRDIKPSNLILDAGGAVKILDLGLAQMEKEADPLGSDESDSGLTRPGDMMGTVSFMPPEQAYNSRDADHRSDIYSLGCTLYYLLTGKPPYSGVTSMACLLAHREQPIPLLRAARPGCPADARRHPAADAGQGARGSLPGDRRVDCRPRRTSQDPPRILAGLPEGPEVDSAPSPECVTSERRRVRGWVSGTPLAQRWRIATMAVVGRLPGGRSAVVAYRLQADRPRRP